MAYCAPNVSLPKGLYGPRLQAVSTQLKANGLSLGPISKLWQALGAPSICPPTILEFTKRATSSLRGTRAAFLHQVQQADVAHKDETGIRRDGKNWWCWTSTTPDTCIFFIDPSRSQFTAQRLIGKTDQVSVTDGYSAYNPCTLRQRCWAHLLREAKEATEKHPDIKDQTDRLKVLFQLLTGWVKDPPATHHAQARQELDDIITCLKARGNAGCKLATHIENGEDDWLTALLIPRVPLTNNLAERIIRLVVLLR
ncbi:transposase, partial [Candidatus Micrarchaeota archaeon]|nr:transposase [Candidatus Micrarchaeota archaeon]